MPHDPTRRDFLKTTALAGTAAAIGVDPPRPEPPNPRTSEPPSYRAFSSATFLSNWTR